MSLIRIVTQSGFMQTPPLCYILRRKYCTQREFGFSLLLSFHTYLFLLLFSLQVYGKLLLKYSNIEIVIEVCLGIDSNSSWAAHFLALPVSG